MSAARLAVLASGGGRSLENLAERCAAGTLDAEVALVVADRPAGALRRAERLGVPHLLLDFRALGREEFARRAWQAIDEARCDLVVLAGFLRLLPVPARWRGRVLNIHPALLPKYGGKGFYGDRVHAAVLAAGDAESGCTVHFVDDQYDTGPHVLQRRVPVAAGDTVESLAARVFEAEKDALPEAVGRVLRGEVTLG